MTSLQCSLSSSPTRRNQAALLKLVALGAVLAGSIALLFASSLAIVVESFRQPEFSHGYIIPVISGWIVWQRRQLIAARRGPGAWSGWLVVAGGAGIALLCHAANLLTPPYVGLLLLLVGLPAAAWGWAAARLLVVPVAFLALAYPLPDNVHVALSVSLQELSSAIGAGVLDRLGVPVLREGNLIDLGPMQLQVAEACSGLRYLLPLISFSVLCAFIYRGPWWAKLAVVEASIPLAIVLNGLRIAVTGLVVHWGSIALAEGFLHLFEGWVVFLLALAVLFALMYAMSRLQGWRGRFVDMLDFDRMAGTSAAAAGSPPQGARAAPALAQPPLLASVATVAVAALLLAPLEARPSVVPDRPGLLTYPLTLGEWQGAPSFLDATIDDVLGADDYLLADFDHGGKTVNLWVAYYDSLLDGSHYHSPTTCLPGAGWEYVEYGTRTIPAVAPTGATLLVNRGVIVKGDQRIVMYFWLELRGRAVAHLQKAKFFNLWDSIATGRSDGALVRVYTPLRPDEAPAAGDARLVEFLKRAYPNLEPHVGA